MIEQSDSDSETSACPLPVFVREEGNDAAQQDEDDVSIVPINAPDEGAPPNIPFVESDDAPVSSDAASVADFYSFNEPDSKTSMPKQANLGMPIWLSLSNQQIHLYLLTRADSNLCHQNLL